jgi:hypothetical protein
MDPVAQRAHRILRTMTRCRYLAGRAADVPTWLPSAELAAGERWLAVYENAPSDPAAAVGVTNLGLWLNEAGAWRRVRYDAIQRGRLEPPVLTGRTSCT